MLETERLDRQEKLHNILLSSSTKELTETKKIESIVKELSEIYTNGFRHSYSQIFPVVLEVKQDDKYNIEFLTNNLQYYRHFIEEKYIKKDEEYCKLYMPLLKLFDHVNLEISRLSYLESTNSKVDDLCKNVDYVSGQFEDVNESLHKAKEKASNVQKETVAVLGIFAAIVLSFTGGIGFSTSVLNNIHKCSIYRIICVALILGLVLINVLYLLVCYIKQIINGDEVRFDKFIKFTDIIIILVLVVNCVCWHFGVVENRNKKIQPSNSITQTVDNKKIR